MIDRLGSGAAKLRAAIKFLFHPDARLERLRKGLDDRQGRKPGRKCAQRVRRIFAAYSAAKTRQANAPAVFQPGKGWAALLKTKRKEYLSALQNAEIVRLTQLLANLFRNSGVAGTWTHGYYSNIRQGSVWRKFRFIEQILTDYRTWQSEVGEFVNEVSPPVIGNPWGYYVGHCLVMPPSFRHHYFAHRIGRLLRGRKRPTVLEIGGGFGGMAYYLCRDNPEVCYINLDLPEALVVSSYYLLSAFPERNCQLFGEKVDNANLHKMPPGSIACLPNYVLPEFPNCSVDLIVNTASLSEMDPASVSEYLSHVGRVAACYFLHENSDSSIEKLGGSWEVPASDFPIPSNFTREYSRKSVWSGNSGRYVEACYSRQAEWM